MYQNTDIKISSPKIKLFATASAAQQPGPNTAGTSFADLLPLDITKAASAPAACVPAPAPSESAIAAPALAAPAKATRGDEVDRFDRAVGFLASIAGGGPVALAAIVPDGGLTGQMFDTTRERTELRAWLQDRNGQANLYYTLNEPKPEGERKGKAGKLTEDDVARIRGIAVDLDPNEGNYASERERLLGVSRMWPNHFIAPASVVVNSGNGVQIIWLFPEPLPNDAETRSKVKAQAKGLGQASGSDPVQSVDHLFRVPWTVNLPNEKKRLKGRTPANSNLLHFDRTATCTLETLATVAAPIAEPAITVDLDFDYQPVIASAEGEPLPAHLAPVADAIRSSKSFATAMTNGDKSGRDYAVLRCVIEHGRLSDPTEIGIVAFSLSPQRLLEDEGKGRGGYYASETIKKALAKGGRPQDWLTGAPAALDAPRAALSEQPATSPERLDLHVVTGVVDPKSISVRKWIVEPQVPVGDIALCIGEPGVSKSTLALRTALAVATGREDILRGRDASGNPITVERLHRSGVVLVYNAEDRLDEMKRRLRAAQVHHGVTVADMRHPIILYSGVDMPTFKIMSRPDSSGPLKRAEGADLLEEAIRRHDVKLVIADPLVALADGALENDNNDMDTVLQTFANMAAKLEIGMMLLHHTNKGGRDKAGDMGAARGASAIAGKVRVAFTLTRVSGNGENEAEWGLKAEEHLVRLDYAKRTLSKPGNETVVFKRASVPVGNGTGRLPQGVENLFSASPLARLEAEGDTAPVLEVVDVKARTAAAKAGADSNQRAEAKQIAVIADAVLGDVDRAKLADLHDEFSAKMNAARICKGTTRNTVKDRVLAALLGDCEIERNGQVLRMCVERESNNEKAAWYVVRKIRNTSDIQSKEAGR